MSAMDFQGKLNEIYPMPHILVKVFRAVSDPDSNYDQLEAIVKHDPAFTLKILSLANSAYYGRSNITSIREAIGLLGTNTLKNLCINVCAHDLFSFGKIKYNFSGYELWKHSVGVGICARVIGDYLGCGKQVDFFTMGILHDIGLTLEYQLQQEVFMTFLNCLHDRSKDLVALEEDVLGTNHATLSKMLCEQWLIPEEVGAAVGWHHAPLEAPEQVRFYACLLAVADRLVMERGFGFVPPYLAEVPDQVLQILQLDAAHLRQVNLLFTTELAHPGIPLMEKSN